MNENLLTKLFCLIPGSQGNPGGYDDGELIAYYEKEFPEFGSMLAIKDEVALPGTGAEDGEVTVMLFTRAIVVHAPDPIVLARLS